MSEIIIPQSAGANRKAVLPSDALVLVVMGVSGAGKSTIGSKLAAELGWQFQDGDWFHPPANVEKMRTGTPLADEDRWPWLRAIAAWIDNRIKSGGHGVVACSALKRRYRDVLIGNRPNVRLVYLKGSPELIAGRLALRNEHFMPSSLLKSQFEVLEEPGSEECPIVASIEPPPGVVISQIISALALPGRLPGQEVTDQNAQLGLPGL
ncbi:MAG TPA: gluconokinase [Xanthobacteraceae bacterium]|nr:gluconokinase [Xanthobacteraceae bacterium]